MKPILYVGITDQINIKDRSLLFLDIDSKDIKVEHEIKKMVLSEKSIHIHRNEIYKPIFKNWLLYKTLSGYHLISLNMFRNSSKKRYMEYLLSNDKIPYDKKYLDFCNWDKFQTIRISKKMNEEKELIFYHFSKFPISKPHFIIYSIMFPTLLNNYYQQKYFDKGIELIGYKHNIDNKKVKL